MHEKGFRELRCANPQCGKTLRFRITPAMYGKTGIITCKVADGGCGTRNRATIPVPAEPVTKPATSPNAPFSDTDIFGDIFGDVFGKK